MNAHCLIREAPWYRRDIFVKGLTAAGHRVVSSAPDKFTPDTLLVIWNRYSGNHTIANQVERGGGKVIVAENGYLGRGGTSPKFDVHPNGPQPHHYYSLSLGFHNDDTRIRESDTDRWATLDVEIKPWREGGDYVLVCPNRSFGVPGRSMPEDWAKDTAKRLEKFTTLPVRIRKHPGNDAPKHTLQHDLAGAAGVVVWTSSCGIHALAEGIPVICEAPFWICKSTTVTQSTLMALASENSHDLALDRDAALRRMAWAQWTCAEIATGEPFKWLLQ